VCEEKLFSRRLRWRQCQAIQGVSTRKDRRHLQVCPKMGLFLIIICQIDARLRFHDGQYEFDTHDAEALKSALLNFNRIQQAQGDVLLDLHDFQAEFSVVLPAYDIQTIYGSFAQPLYPCIFLFLIHTKSISNQSFKRFCPNHIYQPSQLQTPTSLPSTSWGKPSIRARRVKGISSPEAVPVLLSMPAWSSPQVLLLE
jgi:hypothetical protein